MLELIIYIQTSVYSQTAYKITGMNINYIRKIRNTSQFRNGVVFNL